MTNSEKNYILQPHKALNCLYQQYKQLGDPRYSSESSAFSQLVRKLSEEFALQYHQHLKTQTQTVKICILKYAEKTFYLEAEIQTSTITRESAPSEESPSQEKVVQLPIFSAHTRKEHRHLLATHVGMIAAAGDKLAPYAQIVLATGRVATYSCKELLNTYTDFLTTLQNNLREYCVNPQKNLDFSPHTCGKCSLCKQEQKRLDDLYLLPGISPQLRQALHKHGIYKVRQLALQGANIFAELPSNKARTEVYLDSENTLTQELLQQARRQTAQNDRGVDKNNIPAIKAELQWWNQLLRQMPASNRADIYIDFESNPFWDWSYEDHKGLVYLAGIVSKIPLKIADAPKVENLGEKTITKTTSVSENKNPEATPSYQQEHLIHYHNVGELSQAFGRYYSSWTATNFSSEEQLFSELVEILIKHLQTYPCAHIYHYSEQEKVYLRRLAQRYGKYIEEIENLIVPRMIDLLEIVRKTVIISQGSKTLKDIEPIYMGKYLRQGSVTDGADSVAVFDHWNRVEKNLLPEKLVIPENEAHLNLIQSGTITLPAKQPATGNPETTIPEELKLYNEYDCVSTLMLHQWISQEYAKSPRSRGLKTPREV